MRAAAMYGPQWKGIDHAADGAPGHVNSPGSDFRCAALGFSRLFRRFRCWCHS